MTSLDEKVTMSNFDVEMINAPQMTLKHHKSKSTLCVALTIDARGDGAASLPFHSCFDVSLHPT